MAWKSLDLRLLTMHHGRDTGGPEGPSESMPNSLLCSESQSGTLRTGTAGTAGTVRALRALRALRVLGSRALRALWALGGRALRALRRHYVATTDTTGTGGHLPIMIYVWISRPQPKSKPSPNKGQSQTLCRSWCRCVCVSRASSLKRRCRWYKGTLALYGYAYNTLRLVSTQNLRAHRVTVGDRPSSITQSHPSIWSTTFRPLSAPPAL